MKSKQRSRGRRTSVCTGVSDRVARCGARYGRRPVMRVVRPVESQAVLIAVSLRMSAFPNAARSSFGTLDGDVYRPGG
jgi:hypothetical protein